MMRLGLPARLVAALLGLALAACAAHSDPPKRDVRLVLYSDPSSLSLIGNTDQNSALIIRPDKLMKLPNVTGPLRLWERESSARTAKALEFRTRGSGSRRTPTLWNNPPASVPRERAPVS